MSVLKRNRNESQFEVFHHFYKLRHNITDLLLRDFGWSYEKSQKRLESIFGGRSYEDLTDSEKEHYNKLKEKYDAFDEWFIESRRNVVMNCLDNIGEYVFSANSIYPNYMEELIERRVEQDKAIGQCNRLLQELQYVINELPVDVNIYTRFADDIQKEINLIKGWRRSDNKFARAFSDSSANFANVNSNGNANNNNASNANGVRPDFDSAIK